MHFLVIMLVMLAACGKRDKKPQDVSSGISAEVTARVAKYCELSRPLYQAKKYTVDKCDGAGFTSLYAVACQDNGVDLSVFQDPNGSMHRDPDNSCYVNGSPGEGSAARYSKDHVIMRMVAALELKDLAWAESFISYAEGVKGVFCDAKDEVTRLSRCVLTPGLWSRLYDLRKRLRGEAVSQVPDTTDPVSGNPTTLTGLPMNTGFAAHLDVVRIFLDSRLYGAITTSDRDILKHQNGRIPEHSLYAAAYLRFDTEGSINEVNAQMSDEVHWPKDALPGPANHCSSYLWTDDRLDGNNAVRPDWLPCQDDVPAFDATDYLFAAYVLGH